MAAEPHAPIVLSSALNVAALLLILALYCRGHESWVRGRGKTRDAARTRGTLNRRAWRGSTRLVKNKERKNEMSWKKILEALYGFIGALLGALAGAGCSLMGSGVGMTMH